MFRYLEKLRSATNMTYDYARYVCSQSESDIATFYRLLPFTERSGIGRHKYDYSMSNSIIKVISQKLYLKSS